MVCGSGNHFTSAFSLVDKWLWQGGRVSTHGRTSIDRAKMKTSAAEILNENTNLPEFFRVTRKRLNSRSTRLDLFQRAMLWPMATGGAGGAQTS